MNAQSSELNFPETYNLYMTSKNETMNSRIHEFKILQKRPASLLKPLYDDLLYPNYYFKNIFKPCFSILKAFKGILQHFKFVNCWLVVSFFDVTDRYILAKWLKFKVDLTPLWEIENSWSHTKNSITQSFVKGQSNYIRN